MGWVGAIIDGSFDPFKGELCAASTILCRQVVANGGTVKNCSFLGGHLADKNFEVQGLGQRDGGGQFGVF